MSEMISKESKASHRRTTTRTPSAGKGLSPKADSAPVKKVWKFKKVGRGKSGQMQAMAVRVAARERLTEIRELIEGTRIEKPIMSVKGVNLYTSSSTPSEVAGYVRAFAKATPMEIIHLERAGVKGSFIKKLSKSMDIPSSRIFDIVHIPKATAAKKASSGEMVSGSAGQAVLGMVKLLTIAEGIVANSKAADAKGFDSAKWLGRWIEHPQPSLGGLKPADLLDTPTGVDVVGRLLGSIESGAFQ